MVRSTRILRIEIIDLRRIIIITIIITIIIVIIIIIIIRSS
jgi:hypothetical protein